MTNCNECMWNKDKKNYFFTACSLKVMECYDIFRFFLNLRKLQFLYIYMLLKCKKERKNRSKNFAVTFKNIHFAVCIKHAESVVGVKLLCPPNRFAVENRLQEKQHDYILNS